MSNASEVEKIKNVAIGGYIVIQVHLGPHTPDAIEKGTLKSVDWNKRTLVLHHQVYGDDRTIHFDKITYIGSEASSAPSDNRQFSYDELENSMPHPPTGLR